jgi:hypothetical protein
VRDAFICENSILTLEGLTFFNLSCFHFSMQTGVTFIIVAGFVKFVKEFNACLSRSRVLGLLLAFYLPIGNLGLIEMYKFQ